MFSLRGCVYKAVHTELHLWQSMPFPNATGLFSALHLTQRTHSHLHIPWLGAFHGAMILGGGCGHLEMS